MPVTHQMQPKSCNHSLEISKERKGLSFAQQLTSSDQQHKRVSCSAALRRLRRCHCPSVTAGGPGHGWQVSRWQVSSWPTEVGATKLSLRNTAAPAALRDKSGCSHGHNSGSLGPRPPIPQSCSNSAAGQPPWLQRHQEPSDPRDPLQPLLVSVNRPGLLKDAATLAAVLFGLGLALSRPCYASKQVASSRREQLCTQVPTQTRSSTWQSQCRTTAGIQPDHYPLTCNHQPRASGASTLGSAAADSEDEERNRAAASIYEQTGAGQLRTSRSDTSSSRRDSHGIKQQRQVQLGPLPLAAVSYSGDTEHPIMGALVAFQEWTIGR